MAGRPALPGLRQLLTGAQDGRQRRHLGLPVEVPQLHAGQPPLQLAEHFGGHRRGAVVALAQGGQVGGIEAGVAQQRDPHRRRAEQLADLLPRDSGQQRGRVRAGHDDAGGAQVDVGAEEAVQLRAVIHRQRVQLHVLSGHPAVDHAAHVLADQRAAGQHHALRARLGARGVHQPQRVVIGHRDVRRAGRPLRGPRRGVLPPRAGSGAGQRYPATHSARDFRAGQRLLRDRGEGILGDHPARPAVAEDERDLACVQHEIDGHEHHAQPGGREDQHRELPAVMRQQREPVTLGQPARSQRVRGPVDRHVKLAVSHPGLARHHRQLLRDPAGCPVQQVAERVLARPRHRRGALNSCLLFHVISPSAGGSGSGTATRAANGRPGESLRTSAEKRTPSSTSRRPAPTRSPAPPSLAWSLSPRVASPPSWATECSPPSGLTATAGFTASARCSTPG